MHITNQKLRVDIFTVVISSWNMILISNDFWHEIKMYNFEPYNVLLSISTNIPVLLMTVSRVSYRQKSFQNPKYIVFEFRFETECLALVVLSSHEVKKTVVFVLVVWFGEVPVHSRGPEIPKLLSQIFTV